MVKRVLSGNQKKKSVTWVVAVSPDGVAYLARDVGSQKRYLGKDIDKEPPIWKKALYNGFGDKLKSKLTEGQTMTFVDYSYSEIYDVYDFVTALPTGIRLRLLYHDPFSKNKIEILPHNETLMKLKKIEAIHERTIAELEMAEELMEELLKRDDMRTDKLLSVYEKIKNAAYFGRPMESGE